MALCPKNVLVVCSNCVPNVMLLSSNPQFGQNMSWRGGREGGEGRGGEGRGGEGRGGREGMTVIHILMAPHYLNNNHVTYYVIT